MKKIASIFFLVIFSLHSFGWGATGHRATGLIADRYLSKKARKALQKILGEESIAIASTWMDEIRSDSTFRHVSDWHWVTIPDSSTYENSEKNPKGDVIQTIERLIAELKAKKLSGQQEAQHIKMLIHLIGDIHQPLHVGRGPDKGGNGIKVMWFRAESNLHRVWDSEMIDETKLSYTELAASLIKPTEEEIKLWQKSTVRDWANESLALRNQVYDFKGERFGYSYSYKNMPTVKKRITQAGVRLAGVLNEIYE
ncbi:MAG: S1/P1 nuclease [Flammeovirgaceae bacterium]|nr:S1/P1 nuclease [Flammeovirgaceae bacterium]